MYTDKIVIFKQLPNTGECDVEFCGEEFLEQKKLFAQTSQKHTCTIMENDALYWTRAINEAS